MKIQIKSSQPFPVDIFLVRDLLPCHVDGVLVMGDHLVHEDNQRVAVLLNSHLVVHLVKVR